MEKSDTLILFFPKILKDLESVLYLETVVASGTVADKMPNSKIRLIILFSKNLGLHN